jgi:hypothetical protein
MSVGSRFLPTMNHAAAETCPVVLDSFRMIAANLRLAIRRNLFVTARRCRKFAAQCRYRAGFGLLFALLFAHAGGAVAQTFNQIEFIITSGSDGVRGDSSVTATLQSAGRQTLQVITLKKQTDPAWNANSVHEVIAPLNPVRAPSAIAHIAITLTSHNSVTESNDTWNIRSVSVALNNNGTDLTPLLVATGNPLQQLTGNRPNLVLDIRPLGPAGTFNEIQFFITTGDDDLRDDSSATATLQSADRSTRQVIALKRQTDPKWDNNTSTVVTAPLTPPLTPAEAARIVITLISHNSGTETDDNWNIQSVDVALSNNGLDLRFLTSVSGAPFARLSGTLPSLILPPAGLGMTMPVDADPQVEFPDQTGFMPSGYQILAGDSKFADPSSWLSGSCPTDYKGCLPQWNGTVKEHDGRLSSFLRTNASSQDAKLLLLRAVSVWLGLSAGGSGNGVSCSTSPISAEPCQTATALAQLAVTGRHAFNTFVGWSPGFAPTSSGPQVGDLVQLARQGYKDVSAVPASVTADTLQAACSYVLNQAYAALWAIRSSDPAWRQFRLNLTGGVQPAWFAVSGEDDTPHRPVNVPTAPFPQFDIDVPVTVAGNHYTLTARYMIAAAKTRINLKPPTPGTPAPPIPTDPGTLGPRLAVPSDDPTQLLNGTLRDKNVIIYIHGGGSRLEEAVPMANQFVTNFGSWSDNVVVVSFDLPNSAYDDTMLVPLAGTLGGPIPLDASSSVFEDGAKGTSPGNILNYPVLNFTINFINNFINTLGQRGIINPKQVLAVMGGSLGGNTSLLLSLDPMPSPFRLENPLAFSAPASAPGGGQPTIVAWSATSMVAPYDSAPIIGGSMCCIWPISGVGPTWETETDTTRADYFYNLYFAPTGAGITGLPPDPGMWYRDDWLIDSTSQLNAATSFITQSRFDRYEIYSSLARLWTTAIDTEQAIFSFQANTDVTHATYQPAYQRISARLLLAAGACDDYDNSPPPVVEPPPSIPTGICAGHGVGSTGQNPLSHQDIYGYTHDAANDMRNTAGRTLFINDTGHSIHDERPIFFAQQIYQFLNNPDNNINLTFRTTGDDLRWNSEAHVVLGFGQLTNTPSASSQKPLDFALNYWFHPWPTATDSPNNPCGACAKLTSFHFPSGTSSSTAVNNFTIALPLTVAPSSITSFQVEFIAGTASDLNATDEWKLAAFAACLPGSPGGLISDGFPVTGMVQDFKPSSNNQPVSWQPPSFQAGSIASRQNNCNAVSTNPPPTADVPGAVWSNGVQLAK